MSKNKNQKVKIFFLALFFNLATIFCCLAQDETVYDSNKKRDPFTPLVTSDGRLVNLEQEQGNKNLTLEGIIFDKNGLSYAIVNGEVVKIGDKIGAYQILKIEKNKVVFIKEGEPTEIELKEEEP